MNATQSNTTRKKYPSDISKNGWNTLKPPSLMSKSNKIVEDSPSVSLKEVINAIFYLKKMIAVG